MRAVVETAEGLDVADVDEVVQQSFFAAGARATEPRVRELLAEAAAG